MTYGRVRVITVPTKPTSEVINASKTKLDPKDVVNVLFNETAELKDAAVSEGLFIENEDGSITYNKDYN